MSHVSARWVPRLLTEEEKSARVGASKRFLDISRSDPTFLDRIISTGEMWMHYYEPEDKRISMVWKNRDSPLPKKAKVVKMMEKVMCVVFMDSSGVILVHMVPAGRTVKEAFAWKTISRSRGDQGPELQCLLKVTQDLSKVLIFQHALLNAKKIAWIDVVFKVKDINVIFRKIKTILILISFKRYFLHPEKSILNLRLP